MKHRIGDHVELKQDRNFGDDHVSAGAKGRVTDLAPMFDCCWVRFEVGIHRPVLVPDDQLLS